MPINENLRLKFLAQEEKRKKQKTISLPKLEMASVSPPTRERTASQLVADIYTIRQQDKEAGDTLYKYFLTLQQDKSSKYYNPYRKATNTQALQSLSALDVDISSGINDDFFQKYAGLKNHYRTGIAGTPLAPTKKSAPEEAASYYYNKLLEAEDTTRKAEAEWAELQRQIRYWTRRSDRNYSDEEILAKVKPEQYTTLRKMDEGRLQGTPLQLNRPVGYSDEALYGVIWAARNDYTSGDSFADAVNAALGRGVKHTPDSAIKKRLDTTSPTYNPYLQGSTLDDEAALFGVPSFSQKWLDQNAGHIMGGTDETRQKALQRVFTAEERTVEAEALLNEFYAKPDVHLRGIASMAVNGGLTAEEAIRAYMSDGYGKIGDLIDGINRRQPVGTTRALNFDYHKLVEDAQHAINMRIAAWQDLKRAQEIEKEAQLEAQGGVTDINTTPKSSTGGGGWFFDWLGGKLKEGSGWLIDAGSTLGTDAWKPVREEPEPEVPGDPGAMIPGYVGTLASAGASDVLSNRPMTTPGNFSKPSLINTLGLKDGDRPSWMPAAGVDIEKADEEPAEKPVLKIPGLSAEQMMNKLASMDFTFDDLSALEVPDGYGLTENKKPTTLLTLIQDMPISPEKEMTEAEKSRYLYIRDVLGQKIADYYLKELTEIDLNRRMRESETARYTKRVEEHPVLASLESIVMSPFVAYEGIATQINAFLFDDELERDDPRLIATAIQQAIRQETPKDFSEAGQFFYGVGMSIGDNLMSRLILGPASLASAYGRGSASTMIKIMDDGGTPEQALLLSALNGSFEVLTEKMQMDRFTSILKTSGGSGAKELVKGLLTSMVKSGIPEGMEEGTSNILNLLADVIVRGEDSDLMKQYCYFFDKTGDEDTAWSEVAKLQVQELGQDVLGGVVSGAFFGVLGQIGSTYNAQINANSVQEHYEQLNSASDIHTAEANATAAAMTSGVVNGYSKAQLRDNVVRDRLMPYEDAAIQSFGIDRDALNTVAQSIQNKTGARKSAPGLFGALKGLTESDPRKHVQLYNELLQSNNTLPEVQTIAKLNAVKNFVAPHTASVEADRLIDAALVKAIDTEMAGVDISGIDAEADVSLQQLAQTGNGAFALTRWGQQGLSYIGSLLESGDERLRQIGTVLSTMPTWSQTSIVAEQAMSSMSLSEGALKSQLDAFTNDMQDAEIVQDMALRAQAQAVEMRMSQLASQTDGQQTAGQQTLETARSKASVDRQAAEQAVSDLRTKMSAFEQTAQAFQDNPADNQLMQQYLDATQALAKARELSQRTRNQAQASQAALETAEQNLTHESQKGVQTLHEQAISELRQERQQMIADQLAKQAAAQSAQDVARQSITPEIIEQHADAMVQTRFADATPEDKTAAREAFISRMTRRVMGDDTAPAFSDSNKAFMDRVENRFGVKFVVDDTMAADQEAYTDPVTRSIHINPTATTDDALIGVVMHELTHDAESTGWYNQYRDAVMAMRFGENWYDTGEFQRAVDAKIARYADSGIELTVDQAISEIVAQESRNTIFKDQASVDRLIDTDAGLARRILDSLNRIINDIKSSLGFNNNELVELERARQMLNLALDERAQQASGETEINKQDLVKDLRPVSRIGKSGRLFVDNRPYDFHYAMVPVEDIKTSFDEGYPQQLQPRDMDRLESLRLREEISKKMNPALVWESPDVTLGAPVLRSDNVVLAGNHRADGIRTAMREDGVSAAMYKEFARQNATNVGLSTDDVQDNHMLVRYLDNEVDYEDFADRSNVSRTTAYSETENAARDAARLTPDILNKVTINSKGDINTSANNSFIVDFINRVIPASARNAFVDNAGQVSQRGLERIRNALFQRAYGDTEMTAQLSENTDGVVKNVVKAMTNVAPRVAQITDAMEAGTLHDVGITQEIVTAYKTLQKVRSNDLDVKTYLQQIKMFDEDSDVTKLLLNVFETYKRSPKALTDIFTNIMDVAEEAGDPRQVIMPGIEKITPSREQVVREGIQRYEDAKAGMLAGVQYALTDIDPQYLDIESNINEVAQMESVAQLNGDEFAKGSESLLDQVTNFFNSMGNTVKNPALGNVELTRRGVQDSMSHGIGRNKAIAFAAVPEVIKTGKIIDAHENWKGRGYDTVVMAAPVDIANEPYLVGAVVRLFDDSNSYYLHEVLIEKRTASPVLFKTGADFTGPPSRGDHPSIISLLEQVRNVKQSNPADMDADYLRAVESGDMETAQRMVDEAAEEAGYKTIAYHGTNADFNQFTKTMTGSHWFTNMVKVATRYGDNVKKFYLKQQSPYRETQVIGKGWDGGFHEYRGAVFTRSVGAHPFIADGVKADSFLRTHYGDQDAEAFFLTGLGNIAKGNADIAETTRAGETLSEYLDRVESDDVALEIYAVVNSSDIKSADPVTYDNAGNVIPLSQRFNPDSPDIRFSLTDSDYAAIDAEINRLLTQYGAIPQGEKPTDITPIPQRTSPEKRTRQFARTVSEAGIFDDQQRQEFGRRLVDEQFSYEPISDKAALDHAENVMQHGGVRRLRMDWQRAASGDGMPTKYDIAVGERLLRAYANSGDVDNTMQLTAELSEVMTRAGQAVQAARLLKKMSSEGRLYTVQNAINKINAKIKGPGIELNQDLVQDLLNATTDEARDAVVKELYKDAGQQIPLSWRSRLQALRYFAMLGNIKTHGRNVLGNAIFMPAVKLKNVIATGLEAATGQQERTKAAVINRDLYRAARADADRIQDVLSGGGKMNPQGEIERYRRSFGTSIFGRAAEGISQFNLDMLELEDWIFLRRHYANALAGYLQANNLDMNADEATLNKARQYAVEEAQKATYRDASKLATALNNISQQGGMAGLVVEGILPFKKTPINILKRGVEYSPVGLLDTLVRGTYQLRTEQINANQYIDKLASGMSGTMIAALGMFLQSLGVLRAGFKDDKEDKFLRGTGVQEYAVEIGDTSYTIDWMAPASMPLFVGATLMELIGMDYSDMKPEDLFNMSLTSMSQITEPVFNLSMLEGVNRAIESAQFNETNPITEIMLNSGANFLTQYVPTLFGQIARTIDPVRRRTYVDKNSSLPKLAQQVIEQTQNKLPWLSQQNEPYLDIWGQEQGKENTWVRAFENFLSPGYISDLTPDVVEQMLLEVYRQTGDNGVLPATSSKYFTVSGERINLTSEQYTAFSQMRGQTMYQVLDGLLNNDKFQQLNVQEKARTIKLVLDYANQVGKKSIHPDYAIDTWASTIEKSDDPVQSILRRRDEKERDDKRTEYRETAMKAITNGDVDSLEVAIEALRQSKLHEDMNATEKEMTKYAKSTMENRIKNAYLTAYDIGDETLMELMEDTLAAVGLIYSYQNWLKKADQ